MRNGRLAPYTCHALVSVILQFWVSVKTKDIGSKKRPKPLLVSGNIFSEIKIFLAFPGLTGLGSLHEAFFVALRGQHVP
jgi:hypothetical protein